MGETALGDIRVLDLAGPIGLYCTRLLADLGADVVKIEKPGGDPARAIGPFFHDEPHPEKSLYWFNLNINKRSITLNLETVGGREILQRLVKSADIMIETFPPGYLDEIGLGYSVLSQINPRLILTSITPFGQTGPYRSYKASDIVGVAMGGLMFFGGQPEDPPNQPGASQGYHSSSLSAAVATMVALYYRDMTGDGQQIDVSMQESVANCLMWAMPFYDLNQWITIRQGLCICQPAQAPRLPMVWYDLFPCKDGWVVGHGIGGAFTGGEEAWDKLVAWMDNEGMAGDLKEERRREIALGLSDAQNLPKLMADGLEGFQRALEERKEIEDTIARFLLTKTKEEIYEKVQPWRVPTTVIHNIKEVVEDPQLNARNFFVDVEHPELGITAKYTGVPYRLSKTPAAIRRRAPLIGEHNLELYEKEMGFSRDELIRLKEQGVI